MPYITVGARRLRYRDGGASPVPGRRTLVLLHGAGASSAVWERPASYLARHYNVVTADLPAHGRSKGPPLHSIDAGAAFTEELLDAFGLRKAVIGGHSMGGLIAQRVAVRFPERIDALVLANTGARVPISAEVHAALDRAPVDIRRRIARDAFGRQAAPGFIEAAVAAWPYCSIEVARADFQACDAFDGSDDAKTISAPALVVVASSDRVTPPRMGEELAGLLPHGELCEIGGAGHMLPVEQPAALARAMHEFLER